MSEKEIVAEKIIKCPFCFELDPGLKIKDCKNKVSLNFFCPLCRSSGYLKKHYFDDFLLSLITIETVHDGMLAKVDLDDIPDEGVKDTAKCFLCESRKTKLKKTKKKSKLSFRCHNCDYVAFFNNGYINLFLEK